MNPLEEAIIKTLSYADLFDYPLTAEEIQKYLINDSPSLKVSNTSFNSLAAALSDLIHAKQVIQQDPYYALKNRQVNFKLRQTRELTSQIKLTHTETIVNRLVRFPFIIGIFVTGTLAMHNATQNDDIDLLIIAQTSRLWLTRFIITLYLDLTGERRRPSPVSVKSDQYRDKLCLNMWLDESALGMPRTKRNLYTAHEVAQVIPLVNKHHIYERFLSANAWVKRYLPNTSLPVTQQEVPSTSTGSSPLNALEMFFYRLQRFYMRAKITRETISPHVAFFHPRNTGSKVMGRYQAKIDSLLKP